MPGGVFDGLGKWLSGGNAYLQQHQQFIERLRGMQLEDAKVQLATYVRGMPDVGFTGLKLALTFFANTKDPVTRKMLTTLVASLDAMREGRAPAAASAPLSPASAAPAPTFDEDLTLVAGWHELDPENRAGALTSHLAGLPPDGFRVFREHVGRMASNASASLREHEAAENSAWGSSVEDRMSYMMARLKTGQRDPQFVARLRLLKDYVAFYEWVGTSSDLVWQEQERERQRRAAERAAAAAPVSSAAAPADAVSPSSRPAEPAGNGALWLSAIPILRTQLEEGLANGRIRPERRASYERLLAKMEGLVTQLVQPDTPLDEKQKLLERFKGLTGEFQQFYESPGPANRLDALPATARARALEGHIGRMKGLLFRELAQSPPHHTAERAGELVADLTRAHQEIAQLAEDEAATLFEREMLRVTAQGVHDFVQREHLMLARPLWQCDERVALPHALFYAGAADLEAPVRALAGPFKLDLPSVRGQYYGQARWDALRACHAGVFDLRGWRPGLVRTDRAAAAALAATAYEIGLACALGKPIVIVTRTDDRLPFDVDLAPCELSGDRAADDAALAGALDAAWYGRQRTSGASSLAETFAFLDRLTRDHPRRGMLEASGVLDERQIDDAIGFAGCVKQILREQGLGDLQVMFPAWAGRYPDAAEPAVFHVMPFSEPWSDEIRDAARDTCVSRGYEYRRGDESDEGRIIEAVWDDICRAHVVLVDLTGLNLNVLIELGMAHALGRTVLLVRRAGLDEPLPRNIEKLRALAYDSPASLSRLIESRLAPREAGV